jgi:hypothetical protein
MKPARPRQATRRQPENPTLPYRGNAYLYGIAWGRDSADVKSLGAGVGDPPRGAAAVEYRDVAALTSEVIDAEISAQGVRGMRRDMKAHAAFLLRAAASMTILPARFGLVFPGAAALISQLLAPQYEAIVAHLKHVAGGVEVTLRATYIEPQILREVLAAHPELAGIRGGNYSSKIDLGKQIAAAIEERRQRDARLLVRRLSSFARDLRLGRQLADLMVLNASFLVEREKLPAFDQALERISAEARDLLTFDCVGPLPPYSFTDLRIT